MSKPKVLIAIQHSNESPWKKIKSESINSGWLSEKLPAEIEVVFFEGKPRGKCLIAFDRFHESFRFKATRFRLLIDILLEAFDNLCTFLFFRNRVTQWNVMSSDKDSIKDIQIHMPDVLMFSIWKQISLFTYFLEESEADFLFSTNTSNFLLPRSLLNVAEKLPEMNCYAGSVYRGTIFDPSQTFVSGANRFLSRDLVLQAVTLVKNIKCHLLEDVALGDFFINQLGVSPIDLPTLNLSSLHELSKTSNEKLLTLHQVRIKCEQDREVNDLNIFRELSSRINNMDG